MIPAWGAMIASMRPAVERADGAEILDRPRERARPPFPDTMCRRPRQACSSVYHPSHVRQTDTRRHRAHRRARASRSLRIRGRRALRSSSPASWPMPSSSSRSTPPAFRRRRTSPSLGAGAAAGRRGAALARSRPHPQPGARRRSRPRSRESTTGPGVMRGAYGVAEIRAAVADGRVSAVDFAVRR